MRTALVGAVGSTKVALDALVSVGEAPLALITLPPDRAARHSDYVDLSRDAIRYGIEVVHAADVNDARVTSRLVELRLDHLFVIGWSQVCRRDVLRATSSGAIGYHPSRLPQNRGRAVIPWTILLRLDATASTLFWLDEGVDSGDILMQEAFAVDRAETAASLYDKHLRALDRMTRAAARLLATGTAPRERQDDEAATYCARRTPSDGWIDWARSAEDVWTLIRASGAPYPGAFTVVGGTKVTVWDAEYVGAAPYIGEPGQIQTISAAGATVRCGDGNHVLLTRIEVEGHTGGAGSSELRPHSHLGIRPWDMARSMREVRKT